MTRVKKVLTAIFVLVTILGTTGFAKDWTFKAKVNHRAQQEDWSCGPNTISMWAGYISGSKIDPNTIAKKYTGVNNGTTITEFMSAMYYLTPTAYTFSEWEYDNKYTAIKGIMYGVARFNEPIAIAGNDGNHYYLVVGGVATKDPYTYYGTKSSIKYLYLHDSREDSPLYTNPKVLSKYWASIHTYPLFKKGTLYTPSEVLRNWTKIGSLFDKKWRSIERNTPKKTQGVTYENNNSYSSY